MKKSVEISHASAKADSEPKNNDEKQETEANAVGLGELFRFADSKDKVCMILGTLAGCAHGSALPLMILVFGNMTDLFIGSANQAANQTSNNTISTNMPPMNNNGTLVKEMGKYAIYYTIIGACVLLIGYLQISLWMISSNRQSQRIRVALFNSIMKQEIGWFDTHESGELNSRLADDVTKIQEGIGDKLAMFFQWFCAFLTGVIMGFAHGWKLTLVILAVSPALAGAAFVMSKVGAWMTNKELNAYAKAGSIAEEVLGAIRTVTSFSGQKKECIRYNSELENAKGFGIRKGFVNGGSIGLVFLIMFSSYGLAFWYGSRLVRQDEYSAGKLLIVFFSVLIGAFSLGNAAPNLQHLATARGAAHAIFRIIDNKPSIDSSSKSGKKISGGLRGDVKFLNIKFSYPSRPDVVVLDGLHLVAEVGKTTALVGSSGCGKSTTIQLLQRFYDPCAGNIYIDDINIKEYNLKWLRQQIGVVSQEPILFATTIMENIRFGREDASEEDIYKAAKEANAYDFIMQLPKKFQTLAGERGAQLSGGQKQRIAIARALVRNPRILLLDEATSALDTESEATVQAALDKARSGRTTFVIAHRLSTVKTADTIAGFRNGRIVEYGTHEELMKIEKGVYYQLVTTQTNKRNEELYDIEEYTEDTKEENAINRQFSQKVKRMRSISSGDDIPEENDDLPEASFKRIMKLNRTEWPFIVTGCLGALISGGVQPAFAIIFSEILGVFSITDLKEQEKEANKFSGLFVAIGAVAGLAMFLQSASFSKSGEILTLRLRRMAFKALMSQEIAYFDDKKNNLGALTTRLATDASAVQGATGARLGTIIQSFCSIVTGLVIGFVFSWKLSLLICGFAPFMMIGGFIQMRVMTGGAKGDKEALEEAGKISVEAIENIRTVVTLTKEDFFIKNYNEQTQLPMKRNLKSAHIQGIAYSFSQSIIFFAYAACFSLGAYLIEKDNLEYQNMFKVISAIVFGAMAVGQASSFAPDYGKAKVSAAKLFDLFDRKTEIDSFSTEGLKLDRLVGHIRFNKCNFSYPSRISTPILRNLDLEILPGKTTALVGSSGCGKSTTISLLERFYNPLEGSIQFDGQDIKSFQTHWFRSIIGLVQQEPILFDTSIKENIAYGDNERDVSMDEIINAAKSANIHDFISSLPLGYDTNVGDKGAQLSGGQKQRIAIARALIRNPKVLLLDEATSALDTESEKVVQEALDKARLGRTCVVIAHRLSTIHNADKIIVLKNGQVEEEGTHHELMANKNIYYKLNVAQTSRK
ncbi:DgyrCDS6041 [Dimorphilus gyrociliatus]|uniref:DgyrCDS6041 n=1 Tax=Dimorphilus gyrociliatus TaxID=2664684 RepID=A0A7I8VRN1_9ANNE|nr:DgyrCDS6041 [Dimorphilus gyrociliatus]